MSNEPGEPEHHSESKNDDIFQIIVRTFANRLFFKTLFFGISVHLKNRIHRKV